MTDDEKLSFLDAEPNDKTEAEKVVTTTPLQPEVETQAAPVEETQVTQPREDHNPLLPKYLDTFHKLRDAETRLRAFEEAQKEKAEMPDPLLDPEGYRAVQQREVDEKIWNERARMSEIASKRFYGPEVVQAAFEALQAQSDPLLGMHIRRSADPWDEIVKWHQTQQMLSEVGPDPTAYKQRVIAEWQAEQVAAQNTGQPPPVQTPPAKTQIPPPSLTKAPAGKSKASDVPTGPGNAFDGAFAR